jgi:hypothetical protein
VRLPLYYCIERKLVLIHVMQYERTSTLLYLAGLSLKLCCRGCEMYIYQQQLTKCSLLIYCQSREYQFPASSCRVRTSLPVTPPEYFSLALPPLYSLMEGGSMGGGEVGGDSSAASGTWPNYGVTPHPFQPADICPPLAQLALLDYSQECLEHCSWVRVVLEVQCRAAVLLSQTSTSSNFCPCPSSSTST